MLVAINNGLEPMPAPLDIDIGANSNVPSWVKALLEERTMTSRTSSVAALQVMKGRAAVHAAPHIGGDRRR